MSSGRDRHRNSARQGLEQHERKETLASGTGADVQVIGVSRRIWALLTVLALVACGVAFAFFRAQGALDAARTALSQAQAEIAELRLSLKHATDAREDAMADKELLVKELAAQGEKLAEFSRGEEQAKSQAERASSGVQSAREEINTLKSRLEQAQQNITALTAELEITRTELQGALEEIARLQREAAPYTDPNQTPNR